MCVFLCGVGIPVSVCRHKVPHCCCVSFSCLCLCTCLSVSVSLSLCLSLFSPRAIVHSFERLFHILRSFVAHPVDRVAAAALQVLSDAVTHLNWPSDASDATSPASASSPSRLTAAHTRTVASVLPTVVGCLQRPALRRPARLVLSAAASKHGLDLVSTALVECGLASSNVCRCGCRGAANAEAMVVLTRVAAGVAARR